MQFCFLAWDLGAFREDLHGLLNCRPSMHGSGIYS